MRMGLVLVFLRFSELHQILTYKMGFNLHLLYIFGLPTLIGAFACGGFRRAFTGPGIYCSCFAIWLVLATPFSTWRGGSFEILNDYLRTNIVMLFVIAGLIVTWSEVRQLMMAVVWGGLINILTAKLFPEALSGSRLGLEFGSLANPNDFAAHLLLILPFLIWAVASAKSRIFRAIAAVGAALGLYLILGTASRGALVGIVAACLYALFRGTARIRTALLICAPIAAMVLVFIISPTVLARLLTFSTDMQTADSGEAAASAMAREYLLRKSIEYTFTHPLFGVGAGEFKEFEGTHNIVTGTHGQWQEAHNSLTQVASECGIPAVILMIASIVSALRLIGRTLKRARTSREYADIANAAFFVNLGCIGFFTAFQFVNFAYFFYVPAICGIAIALSRAADIEFGSRLAAAPMPGYGNQQQRVPRRPPISPFKPIPSIPPILQVRTRSDRPAL